MGRYNVLSKVDRALAAYLISEECGTAADVFHGKRAEDVPNPPYTVCFSESGRETSVGSGVYRVKARIDIMTNAAPDKGEDTEAMRLDSDDRVSKTWDAFHIEENDQSGGPLGDRITEAARASTEPDMDDFTVQDVILGEMEQGASGKEGQWMDTLNLEIVCVPANVS